jgi:signal peptidase I
VKTFILIIFLLILCGCKPTTSVQPIYAPSSSLTYEEAVKMCNMITLLHPNLYIYTISPTHSMLPLFNNNAVIVSESIKYTDITAGDIIFYKSNRFDNEIAHTAIQKTPQGWVTKGLNNDAKDPEFVTDANLRGRVILIVYYKR